MLFTRDQLHLELFFKRANSYASKIIHVSFFITKVFNYPIRYYHIAIHLLSLNVR